MHFDNTFSTLPPSFYTRVMPAPVQDPRLITFNAPLADAMGIPIDWRDPATLTALGGGQQLLPGMDPLAMKYTGHQFGVYNPDLGDGRGLLLGESVSEHGGRWDWHLKGAGQTPYSRFGDGRAVLRSSIREYLGSEAMAGLGIPTTRALMLVASRTPVQRETVEPAATLIRVARTHIRFGHFEYLHYHGTPEDWQALFDYVVKTVYPELTNDDPETQAEAVLSEIIRRTARLIAAWQSVGFNHGVMNTDNMSIAGDTFDYGPFAFLDDFNVAYICNHSDHAGRYAFNKQPDVAFWNCQALAQAFSGVLPQEALHRALRTYQDEYNVHFIARMGDKLGLSKAGPDDLPLMIDLVRLLHLSHVDYTIFFRRLADHTPDNAAPERDLFIDRDGFDGWSASYWERLAADGETAASRRERMVKVNPKYILRNYLAQRVIDQAAQGNFSEIDTLMTLLRAPFDEHPTLASYADFPPDWGKGMEISCSS